MAELEYTDTLKDRGGPTGPPLSVLFGGSYMPDSGEYQHHGRFPVGEVAYDLCPSTDLSVQSFQRIVGSEPLPMFRGKMEVAQGLLVAFLNDLKISNTSDSAIESWIKGNMERDSDKEAHFVVADRETERYIGQIDFHVIDWKNRSARIGLVIGAPGPEEKGTV